MNDSLLDFVLNEPALPSRSFYKPTTTKKALPPRKPPMAHFIECKSESSETSAICAPEPVEVASFKEVSASPPIHLANVCGYHYRANDIIYCAPWSKKKQPQEMLNKSHQLLIFFGGDVQDLPENMIAVDYGTDFHGMTFADIFKWNLNNTASLLQSTFPEHHIVVIRPSEMVSGFSACYHNFVKCSKNINGTPEYSPMHFGLVHLEKLLQEISKRLTERMEEGDKPIKPGPIAHEEHVQIKNDKKKKQLIGNLKLLFSRSISEEELWDRFVKLRGKNRVMGREKWMENEQKLADEEFEKWKDFEAEWEDQKWSAFEKSNDFDKMYDTHQINVVLQKWREFNKNWKMPDDEWKEFEKWKEEKGKKDKERENPIDELEMKRVVANEFRSKVKLNDPKLVCRLDLCNIKLVGFSKGCVVLNQLLHEFNYLKTIAPKKKEYLKTLKLIKHMYWLDSGHSGSEGAWVTSPSILKTMAEQGIIAHIHVTPYQMFDRARPWIAEEEGIFSEILENHKVLEERVFHFRSEPPSLLLHMNVLTLILFESKEKPVQPGFSEKPKLSATSTETSSISSIDSESSSVPESFSSSVSLSDSSGVD